MEKNIVSTKSLYTSKERDDMNKEMLVTRVKKNMMEQTEQPVSLGKADKIIKIIITKIIPLILGTFMILSVFWDWGKFDEYFFWRLIIGGLIVFFSGKGIFWLKYKKNESNNTR